MRIVFIITRGDTVGGATIHVRDLSRRLIDDGHQVIVYVGAGEIVPKLLDEADVPFEQFVTMERAINPGRDLLTLWKLTWSLKKFHPDIVSAHTSKAGALARIICTMLRIPILYTPHCWSFVDHFPKAKLYRRIERWLRPFATVVIAVSEFERQIGLKEGACSEAKSVTIHNGMPALKRAELAKAAQVPPQLVMVARFDRQKDHSTLIQALAQLQEKPWTLNLIGDGPLMKEVQAQVTQAHLTNRVSFSGYSNQIEDALNRAQIFVLSTVWESFPRSILEAMRAGLPVVATDVGGCEESVLHGDNGYIFKLGNADNLAKLLKQLIDSSDLREQMGRKSRILYEERFTFDIMYNKYLQLYGDVLKLDSSQNSQSD
jgi:glycosyltransferase involved in cell wall biosynthesis